MKELIIRIISMIILLTTFFVIFGFSNQDGQTSGGTSRKVARKIVEIFPDTNNKSEQEKENIVENMQPVIRKLAHFSIYTLAGISMMTFMETYSISTRKKVIISLIVGALYATSDEIHQLFIPGRTAAVTDVLIDTFGVAVGILIVRGIANSITKGHKELKTEI